MLFSYSRNRSLLWWGEPFLSSMVLTLFLYAFAKLFRFMGVYIFFYFLVKSIKVIHSDHLAFFRRSMRRKKARRSECKGCGVFFFFKVSQYRKCTQTNVKIQSINNKFHQYTYTLAIFLQQKRGSYDMKKSNFCHPAQ